MRVLQVVVGWLVAAVLVVPPPAVLAEGLPPTEEPTPTVEPELAALEAARAAVAGRLSRSAGAEARRRAAEAEVVVAHHAVRVAREQREDVAATLAAARRLLAEAEQAQAEAQDLFDRGVALAYKFGGAHATALLLTAMQSAEDVHDLARAVDELDGVVGHHLGELDRRTRATRVATARVERLVRLQRVAVDAVAAAEAAVAPREEVVHQARATARAHEAGLLDAAARALDAEQALLDAAASAGLDVAPTPATVDPLAPGSATVDPATGPSVDQRRSWLAHRRRVLAEQSRLAPAAWAARDDVRCPVASGRFGNDFHDPRSHGRRHLGTDVLAPRGTPVVALTDGVVTEVDPVDAYDGDHDLEGVSVSWSSDVGRFFAAHLDRVAPGLTAGDRVVAGQVVGFVGDSGNARGGPTHLHLGWFVDGVEVNPWPTLAVVCGAD